MKKEELLIERLKKYRKSDMYPFHMPGHKRAEGIKLSFPDPFSVDITEIDGFDNLHHPEGILKDSMEWASSLYGSDRTWYLVNGSTCGLLSAISAAVSHGGKILVSRNCHKAVYHGIYLNHLEAVYVYPQPVPGLGIQGGILPEDVEKALSKTIGDMTEADGIRRGGAAVVVGVGSGEVLALASYPTYDISKWDEIYDTLASDDEGAPLFNRAIGGTYAPGSTFKPCTAVAALESGVITPSTTILDRGIYDYYSSPQPRCWIYSSYGSTHGRVNVSEAITVSCNYFFYEVGRLTGIKTLDDYATQFGLGQYTGIEIGGPNSAEAKGALASPEYAEANDLEWSDGQTLTAAIGQSYNLFTPLQLANYIATLVGNGEHYAAHLLKNVKTYNNSAVVYAYDKDPVNVVEMQDSTVEAIKTGMHDLTTGSLSTYFSKCVVSAGAKTGTAETGVTDANNGTFVCFAPYDDPQIAVAVVIEKGGAGAALAETAVDILNAYFSREEIGTAIIGENTLLN